MKRLRKECGAGIRFFACGEYGPKLGRPHYHACLFNYEPEDKVFALMRNKVPLYNSKTIDRLWGMGYTTIGDVTFQSAAYVARYIMKKITGPEADKHYETYDPETRLKITRIPEFTVMSRRPHGIGKEWYDEHKTDVYPADYVIYDGKKFRPPRFYDVQYEVTDPDTYNRIKRSRISNSRKQSANQTSRRLRARERVLEAKLANLPRDLNS